MHMSAPVLIARPLQLYGPSHVTIANQGPYIEPSCLLLKSSKLAFCMGFVLLAPEKAMLGRAIAAENKFLFPIAPETLWTPKSSAALKDDIIGRQVVGLLQPMSQTSQEFSAHSRAFCTLSPELYIRKQGGER